MKNIVKLGRRKDLPPLAPLPFPQSPHAGAMKKAVIKVLSERYLSKKSKK